MNESEYWEMLWNNPDIEIEHDTLEREGECDEYDDLQLAQRLKNKICRAG